MTEWYYARHLREIIINIKNYCWGHDLANWYFCFKGKCFQQLTNKIWFSKRRRISPPDTSQRTLQISISKDTQDKPQHTHTLTCAFLLSLYQTQQRIQGIGMIYHLAIFQLKPHRNITRRKFAIKKVQLHHLYDIRQEKRCRKSSLACHNKQTK